MERRRVGTLSVCVSVMGRQRDGRPGRRWGVENEDFDRRSVLDPVVKKQAKLA